MNAAPTTNAARIFQKRRSISSTLNLLCETAYALPVVIVSKQEAALLHVVCQYSVPAVVSPAKRPAVLGHFMLDAALLAAYFHHANFNAHHAASTCRFSLMMALIFLTFVQSYLWRIVCFGNGRTSCITYRKKSPCQEDFGLIDLQIA